jgi:hypothetical protein
VFTSLAFELLVLGLENLAALIQFLALALERGQLPGSTQIRVEEARLLALDPTQTLQDRTLSRLEFLRQLCSSLGSFQGRRDRLGIGQHRTQVGPD